ncbi:MAG: hypothetical protein NZ550_03890 [Fimbriimonadales bacterium]|nr:hypothetical protein [Fimbriimonadales bacterium]MDW8051459.1 hypothetical protein [Armatimonadota bacterium]
MRRPTMVFGVFVATAALLWAQPADGRNIPSKYPAPLASQTNYTGFGDHVQGVDYGSELNQLFVRRQGNMLYIGVTGNLEGNGNAIHFYFDTGRSQSNTFNLTTGCINCSVQGMSGVVFDLNPDYALCVNRYDDRQGNDNIYLDWHDLVGNQSTYLGFVRVGSGQGIVDQGVLAGFDNSNVQGVTDNPNNVGDPATAVNGLEVAIPLSLLGNPTGSIRLFVILTGGADLGDPCRGTYLSNQSLPAMNVGTPNVQYPNPAWARCPSPPFDFFPFNFTQLAGDHFVVIRLGPQGDVNGDGCVNNADLLIVLFNFGGSGQGDVNNDGVVNNADLLVVLFNFGQGC